MFIRGCYYDGLTVNELMENTGLSKWKIENMIRGVRPAMKNQPQTRSLDESELGLNGLYHYEQHGRRISNNYEPVHGLRAPEESWNHSPKQCRFCSAVLVSGDGLTEHVRRSHKEEYQQIQNWLDN